MKKNIALLAILLMLCGMLTGCGGSDSGSSTKHSGYSGSKHNDDYSQEYWDAARDAWEKYK